MKAVVRLVLTYFTATPLLRAVTVLGLLCTVGGSAALLYVGPLAGGQGMPSAFSLAQEAALSLLPVAGILCIALGAAHMPTMVVRLATGHYAHVAPYGRPNLLASAFLTIALVAGIGSATGSMYYVRTGVPVGVVFERAFSVSMLSYSILYIVLWLTGKTQTIGKLVGMAAVVATLVLPLRFIAVPSTSLVGVWIACSLLWTAIAAGLLLGRRLGARLDKARQWLAARLGLTSSYRGGGEIDFLIGTARPWPLALGQIVPVAIWGFFIHAVARNGGLAAEAPPNPWLFFLTILTIVSGAMTCTAATRSRALWLRAHWTRSELFARAERAFWRHHGYALSVLLVVFVAVGVYFGLPTKTLVFGVGLLALGTALTTYLGLMVTTSLRWLHAALAVATMLALMITANYAASPAAQVATVAGLEVALAVVAVTYRRLALRRWRDLDWMLCRAERGARA